ncbi:hypothetical protein PT2222_210028 [Paraburkholderia tropica]
MRTVCARFARFVPLGPGAPSAKRRRHEPALDKRLRAHEGHARVAHGARERAGHREQPLQTVGGHDELLNVFAAAAFVAAQQNGVAEIAEGFLLRDDVDERRHVAQTEIDALPRERVDQMRGVADQRDARRDQLVDGLQRERETARGRDAFERAVLTLRDALDFGGQLLGFELEQFVRVRRLRRPHERNVLIGQRQQRDDLAVAEPLIRAFAVRLFRAEIGDHAGLPIVAAFDRRADLRAHPRVRAVRAHGQIGFDRAAVREADHGGGGIHVERLRARVDPREVGLEMQRGVHRALDQRRFGDPRELRNRRLIRREVQFRSGVAEHAHVVDGREPRGIRRLPDPQPLEQRLRAARKGVDARVEHGARRQRRARLREQRHAQAVLGQRQRRRLADEPAADHGDIKGLVACSHPRIIAVGPCLTGPDGRDVAVRQARAAGGGRRVSAVHPRVAR